MIRKFKKRLWDFIYEYHVEEDNKLTKNDNMILEGKKTITIKMFGVGIKKNSRHLLQEFVDVGKKSVGF